MNFRLRQLVGCHVEIRLEDDQTVRGEICHVGSNFVELMVDHRYPHTGSEEIDPASVDASGSPDETDAQGITEIEEQGSKNNKRKKSYTVIFSLEKINHMEHHCGCPGPCTCK
ncbi:hypothetical protein ACLIBG_00510 [Virgibacillus sp. W0181]|uniref:hypothetical protein n=1 Tax=Virgibacillus sp. W0181 TaxID=3391581 RepID=UPI003F44AA38